MFGPCCACDRAGGTGASDVSVPVEWHNAVLPTMPVKAAGSQGETWRTEVSTLSPEEKTKEKMRLQELVQQFSRDVAIGVDCKVLLLSDRQRTQAKYKLDDASLSSLTFLKPDGSTVALFSVVHLDILQLEECKPEVKSAIESVLAKEELNCSLHLEDHQSPDGAGNEVTVVMEDVVKMWTFSTYIKILRLYCQTITPTSDAGGGQ